MSTSHTAILLLRVAAALVLLLLLVVAFGLLAVNYTAGVALLAGLFIALLLVVAIPPVVRWFARRRMMFVAIPVLAVGCIGIAVVSGLLLFQPAGGPIFYSSMMMCPSSQPTYYELSNQAYRLVLQPSADSSQRFTAREQVDVVVEQRECDKGFPGKVLDKRVVTLEPREPDASGVDRGLLLREINFSPLHDVSLQMPDGHLEIVPLEAGSASIEIRNVPKDSFYQALDAENVKIESFIDTQTIRWSARDLTRGVAFAYIPSPWNTLRPLLSPVLGISSLGDAIVAIIAFISTIFVGPIINDLAKDRLKDMLKPKATAPSAPKT